MAESAETGSNSPLISRRVATPGTERRAQSPRDRSSRFVSNPLASASPKMLNRESSKDVGQFPEKQIHSKKYPVTSGISRMREMSYEDSSGGEEEDDDEEEPPKPVEKKQDTKADASPPIQTKKEKDNKSDDEQ
eukprot:c3875_g1_i2.p1 GENE.c3875_g1_i2~~c3875_g1_i2.p1  ORF type:complete len:146 (-),score=26.23 c3875_g1_i2:128-529(-)